jgi:hypothetical protein
MNTEQIVDRIREMTAERQQLESIHDAMIQQNQKTNQEFQQQVMKNQTRFAQLTGGITELQKLLEIKGDNNDDSIPTLNLSDRIAHVCAGEQPESR